RGSEGGERATGAAERDVLHHAVQGARVERARYTGGEQREDEGTRARDAAREREPYERAEDPADTHPRGAPPDAAAGRPRDRAAMKDRGDGERGRQRRE